MTGQGHYGNRLMQAFEKHGGPMKVLRYAFVAGESSKNRETKAAIEDGLESMDG